MPFNQPPPQLGDQYQQDRVLRTYLRRALPEAVLAAIEPELENMGRLAGGELYQAQLADRLNEPRHTPWDAWGNRVDLIEVTPLWQRAEQLAAKSGLIAAAYERAHGRYSRIHQFALVYLFTPSTDVYSCPLAMTDGAARILATCDNKALAERALPRLTDRNPDTFWTSGQWMTESTGGSDVGISETVAKRAQGQGANRAWRLYGRKWFTSAATSQMALTLARPEDNPAGGKGLALFYLETRDAGGALNNITVHRLKDKLGTRKVPTAELTLDGTFAEPLAGLDNGVRNIAPMLNITRTWNSVSAVSYMRRGLALAADYASRRVAFGAPLSQKALHVETLAGLQAEYEAGFHLVFAVVELLGREEAGEADEAQLNLLRLLTPVAKLMTGKQSVAVLSEITESFGGAGYVEDTGIPYLLRDAQVFPIWEGTTNVLSLDVLRVVASGRVLETLEVEAETLASAVREPELLDCVRQAQNALTHAAKWLEGVQAEVLEAGARAFAMTIGRATALLLMARHAQWLLDHDGDRRGCYSALIFCRHGVDMINEDVVHTHARGLMEDHSH
ncbi:MAG: acyl-CoA dehydrogenase family protein [Betaproteobacteria bacterium]|nr:MAG: acyl-CoA dehydrogenase family protein [Betaproteobacteria bacterium]